MTERSRSARAPGCPYPSCAPHSAWRWRLQSAGQDYAEWVPGDWRSGQIAAEITALTLPPGQEATAVVSGEEDPERAFFRALYGGSASAGKPRHALNRPLA